jgi:hypothetical protein
MTTTTTQPSLPLTRAYFSEHLCKSEAIDALVNSPRYANVYVPYKDGVLHQLQEQYDGTQMILTRFCYLCCGKKCYNTALSVENEVTGTRCTDSKHVTFPVYRKIVIGETCLEAINLKKNESGVNPLVIDIEFICFSYYMNCTL